MEGAERWWAIAVGTTGLIAFAGGWMLMSLPPIDAETDDVINGLARRRAPILAGSLLGITGSALLLWPLAAVATAAAAQGDGWASLGLLSIVVWTVAFGFLSLGAIIPAGLVWRDPSTMVPSTVHALLDASHLAVWSLSAPVAIVAVVATTAVGAQAGFFGPWVIVAAGAKVVTALVEIAGTGRRTGWNAGGWAGGTSGYATVAWFASVLASLP